MVVLDLEAFVDNSHKQWTEKPKDIEKSAEKFIGALQKTESIQTTSKLERAILDEAAMNLFQLGDATYGRIWSQHQNFPMLQMSHFCLDMQN